MSLALAKTILILPGTVLVFVPALLVWASGGTRWAARISTTTDFEFLLGMLALAVGAALMAWTVRSFVTIGQGTPAPWDPPKKFVLVGIYRHVRNPMISGVFLVLLAEALLLRSWSIAAWLALFMLANFVYIPLSEEPGLERRFGEDYRRYKANVPRWLLRLRAWEGDSR